MMVWIAANHRDKSVHHQSHHEEDLEEGHIKLCDTEVADPEAVETTSVASQRFRCSTHSRDGGG